MPASSLQIHTTYYLLISLDCVGNFSDETKPVFTYDTESLNIVVPDFYNYYFYSQKTQLFLIESLRSATSLSFSYSFSGFYKSFKVSSFDSRITDAPYYECANSELYADLSSPMMIENQDSYAQFAEDYPEIYSYLKLPSTIDFSSFVVLVGAKLFERRKDYDFAYECLYEDNGALYISYSEALNDESYAEASEASYFMRFIADAFLLDKAYSDYTAEYRIFYSL
ncbi:MAG: hypothetical protein Q4F15_03380 [Bacillota bacterium]|nr:hypothetical protein [Bacillota bacterium]